MRRALVAILGAGALSLALTTALDAVDLIGKSRIGTLSNGVVGRDVLIRDRIGLQPYDHVRSTQEPGGDTWRDFAPGGDYPGGSAVRLRVLRGGRQLELEVHPNAWDSASLGLAFAAPLTVSLLLIGSALGLAWHPRPDPAAPAVISVLGILGLQQLVALDANWSHRLEFFYVTTVVLFPFALIHLTLSFPRPVWALRETPGVIRSLYALGGVTLAGALLLFGSWEERWLLLLRVLELVTLVTGLALSARIVVALTGAVPAADRYRARILAYGAGVAFGVPALCFLIDLASPSNLTGAVLPVSAAAIPMSIGVAVGRQDLLEVEDRYRRLLLPAAVTACSVVALFLILAGAFRIGGIEAAGSPAFSIAFVVMLTLLLEGARRLLFVGVERFRPSPESRVRRFLEQAEHTLPLDSAGGSLEFACGFLLEELQPRFVAVLWIEPTSERLRTVRSAGAVPGAVASIDLARGAQPARWLLETSSYLSSPNLSEGESQCWEEAGLGDVDLALPMPIANRTLGVLALGPRAAGYAPADLDFLSLVAKAIALRLVEEEKLQELETRLTERSSELARALARLSENGGDISLWHDDEERFAWIGKFAAGISHETNKPLYVIEHHLKRLLQAERPDWKRLRAIETEVAQVRRLMQDLQAYSRSRTGAREPLSIASVIDEALRDWKQSENGLRVETRGALDLEADLDAGPITRLFTTLFQNASDAGARKLYVRVRRDTDGFVVEVEDDGPGIPTGLEEQIFGLFFTTRRVGSASGLGLTIAREIAHAHGGTLVARPGSAGANFWLALPYRAPSRPGSRASGTLGSSTSGS